MENKKMKQMIKDLNDMIIKYHGIKELESERDDLCNIRWVLENKVRKATYNSEKREIEYYV
jgi:hypothetical protein